MKPIVHRDPNRRTTVACRVSQLKVAFQRARDAGQADRAQRIRILRERAVTELARLLTVGARAY